MKRTPSGLFTTKRRLALVAGLLASICCLPLPSWGQYDVDDASPVWVRALFDLRVARGGRDLSWTERGASKTRFGGERSAAGERRRKTQLAVGQMALELGIALPWDIVARAQLNWAPDIEADIDEPLLIAAHLRKEWGTWQTGIGLQVGVMNLPFSLEHNGPAWTPRYTLSPSVLNSWLWEEGRTVGLEIEGWRTVASGWRVNLLAGLGFGPDQAGHLLAVRGWVYSDFLSGINSNLPLPTADPDIPVFDERDHRPAVYFWLTLRDPQKWGSLRLGYFDNLGDQSTFGVWHTRFGTVGLSLQPLAKLDVLVQYMIGEALHDPCPCDVRFQAVYALVSLHHRGHRWSVRYDWFRTRDLDRPPDYRDRGDGVTFAYLFEFGLHHRVAIEYILVDHRHGRPFSAESSSDGWQISYRFRY